MEDNLGLTRMLLRNNIDETLPLRLFSLSRIEDMLSEALAGLEDARELQATMDFAIYGSYKLLQDWIGEENRINAKQETELILKLAGTVCRWTP